MIVTIKSYKVSDHDKNGNKLINKKGEPFVKATMTTVEKVEGMYPMSKLFSFIGQAPNFTPGEKVDIEIKKSGDFVNWDLPKGAPLTLAQQERPMALKKEDFPWDPPKETMESPVEPKPDWEKIAEGKVRSLLVQSLIQKNGLIELNGSDKEKLIKLVTFCMNGE